MQWKIRDSQRGGVKRMLPLSEHICNISGVGRQAKECSLYLCMYGVVALKKNHRKYEVVPNNEMRIESCVTPLAICIHSVTVRAGIQQRHYQLNVIFKLRHPINCMKGSRLFSVERRCVVYLVELYPVSGNLEVHVVWCEKGVVSALLSVFRAPLLHRVCQKCDKRLVESYVYGTTALQ